MIAARSVDVIDNAITSLQRGEAVIVVDDENRENEGDLILAAEHATPEKIAFFLRHTSGVLCVALTQERALQLDLPLMVARNTESMRTAFTISVDARDGTTTGISSGDRCRTIQTLASSTSQPDDLLRPGHVFPLVAKAGGVLKRAGHTEAAIDLMTLAGLSPAAVLCEIVDAQKEHMAKRVELESLANEHGLVIISVADLIRYRRRSEKLVTRIGAARMPTAHGPFTSYAYRSVLDGTEHLALVHGDLAVDATEPTLVRVHSECLTGDVFSSRRCDCGTQLEEAMRRIQEEGSGVVVYLRGHEGRGIGLCQKIRAYALQDSGLDTVDANLALGAAVDSREYGIGAQILVDLGVRNLRLLTNNPAKYGGLEGYDLHVQSRVPLLIEATPDNVCYLKTKAERLGHHLHVETELP